MKNKNESVVYGVRIKRAVLKEAQELGLNLPQIIKSELSRMILRKTGHCTWCGAERGKKK